MQTTSPIKTRLAGDAASGAMDGAAHDLSQDDSWREKQHQRGASGTDLDRYNFILRRQDQLIPDFGAGVNPSTNPSRVQPRRYAIPGYAHHTYPEILIDH